MSNNRKTDAAGLVPVAAACQHWDIAAAVEAVLAVQTVAQTVAQIVMQTAVLVAG